MYSRLASTSRSLNIGDCSYDSISSGRPVSAIEDCGLGNSVGGCEKLISLCSSIPSRKVFLVSRVGEEIGDGDSASEV